MVEIEQTEKFQLLEFLYDYLSDCAINTFKSAPGDREWARRDPDLESLRGQPRFEALVSAKA